MKKVLFTATVDAHILAFHTAYLKYFKEKGYEVHVATNGDEEIPYCDKKIKISFERSPFKINNLKAIKQLKKVINEEKYDLIHTHTPMGSVVTRLAAKKARKNYKTRVIYTAHGFHFYKGAPKKFWIMFYPVEKFLARYTDDLITINKEDYELAKKKFKTKVHYVPGVGIDPKKFDIKVTAKEKEELRKTLGIKKDDFVMIYPAELSYRKNQEWLIRTLEKTIQKNKKIHIILPGKDSLNGGLEPIIKELKLQKNVHLLGFRKDIPKLLKISDLAVSSSRQEGLPVNIMEAMYTELPIVVTDCRGNSDLIDQGKSGFIVDQGDSASFVKRIKEIYKKEIDINKMGKLSKKKADKYMIDKILEEYKKIYENR